MSTKKAAPQKGRFFCFLQQFLQLTMGFDCGGGDCAQVRTSNAGASPQAITSQRFLEAL